MNLAEKLEFDKIILHTGKLCISEMGRSRLTSLEPFLTLDALEAELERTRELKLLMESGEELPISSLFDTREIHKKLAIEENFLQPTDLLKVASSLRTASQLKKFVFNRQEIFPNLNMLTERLWMEKSLQYEISQKIDEFAEVRSSASDALQFIRHELQKKREALRRKYEALQRRYANDNMLMDEGITIRNGRLVLGFRVEHKYQIPGFIHDFSQSGQTVFIEPSETLLLSNEIRDLEIQESREIERILRELAKNLRKEMINLLSNQEILTEFDALYAKARFAIEIGAIRPTLTKEKKFKLENAYHPYLLLANRRLGKSIIPLSLALGYDHHVLVMTGPNAGGKSVALKTVGLLALMIQYGFLIPCGEGSMLTLFDNIYVEIGDEQSIENDLSTFSSHLKNLKNILDNATNESLVLIDEICSGTDPEEGAAIATATLESLLSRKTISMVTTHQGTLKAYAHQREGVINGSMQFDTGELRPTYQFQLGLPGSSFALEMAKRMGFAPHVLENAKRFMGDTKHALEDLIAKMNEELQKAYKERKAMQIEREEAKRLTRSFELKLRDLDNEKRELRRQSLQDSKRLLAQSNSIIEKAIKDIKESGGDSDKIKSARKDLEKFRRELANEDTKDTASSLQEHDLGSISIGDKVKLLDTHATGEVLELLEEDVVVSFGNFRLKTQLRNLEKISNKEARETERKQVILTNSSSMNEIKDVSTKLDLRGLLGDEAITRVQKFIDDSVSNGLSKFDIIHGKGTGALRKRITDYLKSDKRIKNFRLGNWDEGGTGVTVVEV